MAATHMGGLLSIKPLLSAIQVWHDNTVVALVADVLSMLEDLRGDSCKSPVALLGIFNLCHGAD